MSEWAEIQPAAYPRRAPRRRQAGQWEPGRWWRAVAPDGSVWCETSDEQEARAAVRPGDRLFRLWQRSEQEWRPAGEVVP